MEKSEMKAESLNALFKLFLFGVIFTFELELNLSLIVLHVQLMQAFVLILSFVLCHYSADLNSKSIQTHQLQEHPGSIDGVSCHFKLYVQE